MGVEQNKLLVRRLVEGINTGSLEVLDEVADASFARAGRQWIAAAGPAIAGARGFHLVACYWK